MRHVVMFSGGISSWVAARRVAAAHGTENLYLIFADTLMEEVDLYRFLVDATATIFQPKAKWLLEESRRLVRQVPPIETGLEARRAPLHALARVTRKAFPRLLWLTGDDDPWSVFEKERFLGNSRIDPCSRVLKRSRIESIRDRLFDPADTIIYVGYDWTEVNRLEKLHGYVVPWRYEAPLMAPPLLSKEGMLEEAKRIGLQPPIAYAEGFQHANCGGGCVKAGHGQWAHLLKTHPERYAYFERREKELGDVIGPVTILKDRRDGKSKRMSLTVFRQRVECGYAPDASDIGGCNCALDYENE